MRCGYVEGFIGRDREAANAETGTPVPHADIYRTPTLLDVELAMFTIGEI